MTNFSPGTIVRARKREWVVLPNSTPELLMLQPLGGSPDESAALWLGDGREAVEHATFALPDANRVGDARASRLLREAARLGGRAGAGPFRSFARIAVEPRPYQMVPLLIALQLEPVRLLIADDVGIGKTIEAALIARELWDRGEITSMAVLCPPHLAEQWQSELREKFHLEATLVLASTVARLERDLEQGEPLFSRYPITVVSLDTIKSDRRRNDFLAACPDLVIVDEAHTSAQSQSGARQQRHKLLQEIAQKAAVHLILVSATPHSGDPEAFRSLLALLNPDFAALPDDLSGPRNEDKRRALSRHLVQRRRGDINSFLQTNTPFPQRIESEEPYDLSDEHHALFSRALSYARELVRDESGTRFRQRVRWWSALSLLRAIASSPAAAAATLRARARNAEALSEEEADALGRRGVFDLHDDEDDQGADITPGSLIAEEGSGDDENDPASTCTRSNESRKLLDLARLAQKLADEPASDRKLALALKKIKALLNAGASPIVFCRFIDSADYVGKYLRRELRGAEVSIVTGLMSPDDREAEVLRLADSTSDGKRRVLVATDCLSEGVNLQAYFDAVIHYDLSWNPTRHEQREGRVDRFGQPSKSVHALTLYGRDNPIDGIVLQVLLKKHKRIRDDLGVSVPVPAESDSVVQAIMRAALSRGYAPSASDQPSLFKVGEVEQIQVARTLEDDWERATQREKRSRTMFAHEGIKPADVAREADAMRAALGGQAEVEAFVRDALAALGVPFSPVTPHELKLEALPEAIQEPLRAALPPATWKSGKMLVRFDTAPSARETLVGRSHPLVAALSAFVLETALDSGAPQVLAEGVQVDSRLGARCGAMHTRAVSKRTTLLLARARFHLHQRSRRSSEEKGLLAEDVLLFAFEGAPEAAVWLADKDVEPLLRAEPEGNIAPERAADFVLRVVDNYELLRPALEARAQDRADALLAAHKRVRDATKAGGSVRVEPSPDPLDILGVWVLLPALPAST